MIDGLGAISQTVECIDNKGSINFFGTSIYKYEGIRPACKINLDKIEI